MDKKPAFKGNLSFLNTVFPHIVSAETILNYSKEETIQGRKLYEEIWYIHKFPLDYIRFLEIFMK